ncbi:MAG: OsmC family protein [Halobacteriota archaeon]
MSDLERHKEPRKGHFEKTADGFTRGVVRDTHEIVFDEPEDLPAGAGDDEYPSPVDYMFSSLIGCQISVLSQCLHKARIEDFTIEADAVVPPDKLDEDGVPQEMPEHTGKRVRHIDIDLTVSVPKEYETRAQRCLEVYDEGCIVGQSFKGGINYSNETNLEVID